MAYKGVAIPEMLPNEAEAIAALNSTPDIEILSWRQAAPTAQYLWTVKPPGTWVKVVRFDEWTLVSDADVPLEMEWDLVYSMLGRHKASLLCRLTGDSHLIAIASARPDGPWLPLMPGYGATVEGPLSFDIGSATQKDLEKLSAEGHKWPGGLLEPSVIHMQTAHSLTAPGHRESWLDKYPEGMWLLSVQDGLMKIFEVLS